MLLGGGALGAFIASKSCGRIQARFGVQASDSEPYTTSKTISMRKPPAQEEVRIAIQHQSAKSGIPVSSHGQVAPATSGEIPRTLLGASENDYEADFASNKVESEPQSAQTN